MVTIVCNGEERQVAPGTTVERFIRDLGLDPATVVAEYNGRILERSSQAEQQLEAGAVLELIRFVGGG